MGESRNPVRLLLQESFRDAFIENSGMGRESGIDAICEYLQVIVVLPNRGFARASIKFAMEPVYPPTG
jgi:hypothetical protein